MGLWSWMECPMGLARTMDGSRGGRLRHHFDLAGLSVGGLAGARAGLRPGLVILPLPGGAAASLGLRLGRLPRLERGLGLRRHASRARPRLVGISEGSHL